MICSYVLNFFQTHGYYPRACITTHLKKKSTNKAKLIQQLLAARTSLSLDHSIHRVRSIECSSISCTRARPNKAKWEQPRAVGGRGMLYDLIQSGYTHRSRMYTHTEKKKPDRAHVQMSCCECGKIPTVRVSFDG